MCPCPWDSAVIGLRCRMSIGNFISSPGNLNVQPSLRTTECGRLTYARQYTNSCECVLFRPLNRWFLKWSPQTSSISILWKPVRNAVPGFLLNQTLGWAQQSVLTRGRQRQTHLQLKITDLKEFLMVEFQVLVNYVDKYTGIPWTYC